MTKLRPLTPEQAEALGRWAQFVTEAEFVTGNPRAVRNPQAYARNLALRLWRQETSLPGIVDYWKWAAKEGKQNEPLWPGTPRHPVNQVLKAVA